MDDIETAPLVAKKEAVPVAKSSPRTMTILAVAVLVTLSLIALCVPSVNMHSLSSSSVINFEEMAAEQESAIFVTADTDKDQKVSRDEV
jgi:hypothetical protein